MEPSGKRCGASQTHEKEAAKLGGALLEQAQVPRTDGPAGTGQQALDKLGPADTNRNGLFTRVFLKEMQKTGVSIDKVLRNVRTEVVGLARAAGHEQVPAIYDQVVGDFYFRR